MPNYVLAGLLALAATGSASVYNRGVCNADNCARLVTGTRAGLPSTRLADCSSFLAAGTTTVTDTATVTPVVTYLSTITTVPVYDATTVTDKTISVVRTTASNSAAAGRRDIGSSNTRTVPSYATASCNPSRYSSACSCAGVTSAKASTTTTTVTVTAQPVTSDVYTAATTTLATTATVDIVKTEPGYACGSNVQGNGIYTFRSYKVHCGQRVTSGNVSYSQTSPDESNCLQACNSIKYCVYAEYFFSNGVCNLYYQTPTSIVDDSNVDALILN